MKLLVFQFQSLFVTSSKLPKHLPKLDYENFVDYGYQKTGKWDVT